MGEASGWLAQDARREKAARWWPEDLDHGSHHPELCFLIYEKLLGIRKQKSTGLEKDRHPSTPSPAPKSQERKKNNGLCFSRHMFSLCLNSLIHKMGLSESAYFNSDPGSGQGLT